jgi:hypothetical protein
MNASTQVIFEALIVQEPLSLAETICDNYIRGKATVSRRDIYWLVSPGLLQEFVA